MESISSASLCVNPLPYQERITLRVKEILLKDNLYKLSTAGHCKNYYSSFFPHCQLTSISLENMMAVEMHSPNLLLRKDLLPQLQESCQKNSSCQSFGDHVSCRKPTCPKMCPSPSQVGPY